MISIRPASLKWQKPLMMSESSVWKSWSASEKNLCQKRAVSARWFSPVLEEKGFILACGDDLALEVFRKLGFEDRVGKLFEEDGGKVQVAMQRDAVAFETGEHAQEWKVGFCSGFMQPLHAMRPGAVVHDVRQVRRAG